MGQLVGRQRTEQVLLETQARISRKSIWVGIQGCEERIDFLLDLRLARCVVGPQNLGAAGGFLHFLLPLSVDGFASCCATVSSLWKVPILVWQASLSFLGRQETNFYRDESKWHFRAIWVGCELRRLKPHPYTALHARMSGDARGYIRSTLLYRQERDQQPSADLFLIERRLFSAGWRDHAVHAKVLDHLAVMVEAMPRKNGCHAKAGRWFIAEGSLDRLDHVLIGDGIHRFVSIRV
jgi:hypothetical protein